MPNYWADQNNCLCLITVAKDTGFSAGDTKSGWERSNVGLFSHSWEGQGTAHGATEICVWKQEKLEIG